MEFTLKTGNTSPALRCILRDGAGVAVPLAGAAVVFSMATQKGVAGITRRPCVITAAAASEVQMNWQAGDTATPGAFHAEFEVTYAGGSVESFPNEGYLVVRIAQALA